MDEKDSWMPFGGIEIGRLEQPVLNWRTARTCYGDALNLRHVDLVEPCGIFVCKLLRAAAIRRDAEDFGGRGYC